MNLKDYQIETLRILQKYLEMCRLLGPADAYKEITGEETQKRRIGRYAQDYRALNGLEDVPYVCLRLPTGGGKTLLAARSIGVARDAWVEKDYPTVLWLVPTNTIRQQTAEALKNPKHPYRQQLDELFEGRVRVFDIGDFTQVRPQDIRDNLTVIVGTIQTLKVANTEGRKVYAHNEDMEPHFTGRELSAFDLEKVNGGSQVKYSFANLLHMVHPIMIVDEAHNAVTGLSRDMQQRVSPSCVIEFTATPRFNSNILHSVTAQELKDEEMIKLPVVLAEHPSWQAAVDGAIQRRQRLENIALKDKRYIRPIVLFQAQKKNEEVTVDRLKKYLVETSGIDEAKIAVATGEQRELDGINLFDPTCRIEYIITVEALKEGWDCPFAYVFCSVAKIKSAAAVEQLLGRVLRMPFAERRKEPELNRAYADVSETTFSEAAGALRDKLVAMGFDEEEAAANIERDASDGDELPLEGGLFGSRKEKPTLTATLEGAPEIPEEDKASVKITKTETGETEITVTGHISDKALKAIEAAVAGKEKAGFGEKVKEYKLRVAKELAPAARRMRFSIPPLGFRYQEELLLADPEILDECHDWSLSDYAARLTEDEFAIHQEAHTFEIDIDGKALKFKYVSDEEKLLLDVEVREWTDKALALALDKLITDPRFSQAERLEWCLKHIQHLTSIRKISLSALWRAKFVLARKLKELIDQYKQEQAGKAFQAYLFAPEAKPEISFDDAFSFKEGMYDGQKPYRGNFSFGKHFLDIVPEIDGKDSGDETQCAVALDSLSEVKHWLRNIPRHPASFWLPVAGGKTYPDFVAELDDGRLLVVEYKGEHLKEKDAHKDAIGQLWEREMKGRGLYLMAVKKDDKGRPVREQLQAKIAIKHK